MRVLDQSAYILHRYPHGETSLILEAFTRAHGRVALMAKGARRPNSPLASVAQPFRKLVVGFSGGGEVMTLTAADADGPAPDLRGEPLFAAFYLNELLLRMLHRHDPHERLFEAYADALLRLQARAVDEAALRIFEKRLLDDLGYGLVLSAVEADTLYYYDFERGPLPAQVGAADAGAPAVHGATLHALAQEELHEARALQEAKRLLRLALSRYLGPKPLQSRALYRHLHEAATP